MLEAGKENSSAVIKYKEKVWHDKDTLFDVFQHERDAQLKLQQILGVNMSPKEFLYHEDKSQIERYTALRV